MNNVTPTARLAGDAALRRYESVRDLIASPASPTPLVRLNRIVPPGEFELHLKLEWFNPFGSIKDRTALYLLKGLEERGELDGRELIEPTSGNTGIALAALAALMGHKVAVTLPDAVPEAKKQCACAHSRPPPESAVRSARRKPGWSSFFSSW